MGGAFRLLMRGDLKALSEHAGKPALSLLKHLIDFAGLKTAQQVLQIFKELLFIIRELLSNIGRTLEEAVRFRLTKGGEQITEINLIPRQNFRNIQAPPPAIASNGCD